MRTNSVRGNPARKELPQTVAANAQPSKLLPSLFKNIDERIKNIDETERLTVLHIGPAQQSTLDFFSAYRCQLHVRDLFSELPIKESEDGPPISEQFTQSLQLPPQTQFDLCLFWDIFNFLDTAACTAFLQLLRPHLHGGTRGHAFAVHNLRSKRAHNVYGIENLDSLSIKSRAAALPGYAPHSQRELKELLYCFDMERSVLLPDSRLELLLRSKS